MLNSPVPLFLNIRALVFLRSISITASETLDSGNIDPRFGDDRGNAGLLVVARLGRRENRVGGILDIGLALSSTLWSFSRLHVAAQLLLDPVGRAVEGHLRLARAVRCLQHHALHVPGRRCRR